MKNNATHERTHCHLHLSGENTNKNALLPALTAKEDTLLGK